jgi:hypothetical protein
MASDDKSNDTGYSTDTPISSRADDRFERWPFAERVARTIASRPDAGSLVVAIYGVWGDGKTSTLGLVTEALGQYDDVIVVRFNPWYFSDVGQLLKGYFETLADALGASLKTGAEKIGDFITEYGGFVSAAAIPIAATIGLDPLGGAKKVATSLSAVKLETLRKRISDAITTSGKRIVVLVDDIDRLDRDEIQALLKLVRLTADFPNTTYLLAFDDEVVADALGEKYGTKGAAAGRAFLEKIIQVGLQLPPANRLALRTLAFEGIEQALRLAEIDLSKEQVTAFVRYFTEAFEPRIRTPRQVKQYVNAVLFALPILKDEVHPVDQLFIEGIRIYYPKLYQVIRSDPDAFALESLRRGDVREERRKELRARVEKGFEGLSTEETRAILTLLEHMFPRLKGVFGNTTYNADWDEQWDREQRACSGAYLPRYFHYAVPSRDVSDRSVRDLYEEAQRGSRDTLEPSMAAILDRGAGARLIQRLRRDRDTIPSAAAPTIALVVASLCDRLPREEGMFGDWVSTYGQAAVLITNLLERVEDRAARLALAQRIATECPSLPFVAECLRWWRPSKDDTRPSALTLEETNAVAATLADRIRKTAEDKALHDAFPKDATLLLWIWRTWGDPQEVGAYLERRFDTDPKEVSRFLATYVGTAWGMETGLPSRGDFERDAYDSVAKLVPPQRIVDRLKIVYGSAIEASEFYQQRGISAEEAAARQFCFIHRVATAEKPAPEAPPPPADESAKP